MQHDDLAVYHPLDTLKIVAKDLWTVDGPLIRFGIGWLKMPFPTRMTIIRIGAGGLLIHSPMPLTAALAAQIGRIGVPRWIIGPNRLHHWWIPQWKTAFPDAALYLAAHARAQSAGRITFDAHTLDAPDGYPWDCDLATLPITGSYMTEVEFFHHASRTLVLTDLIENFEPHKLGSAPLRWMARLGGVQDPDGQTPRDLRLTFARHKQQLRAAVGTMIDWNPERVILAHGRWYERDGTAELRRALRWAVR